MKKNIFMLLFCFATIYLYGQEFYMYVGGQKRVFDVSTSKILVKTEVSETSNVRSVLQWTTANDNVRDVYCLNNGLFMIDMHSTDRGNFSDLQKQWSLNEDVIYTSPVFMDNEGRKIGGLTNQVLIRLKSVNDYSLLRKTIADYQIETIKQCEFDELVYLLTLSDGSAKNAMQAANELYRTGLFRHSEPNLIQFLQFYANDKYFEQQWGLYNTGQLGGTPGVDIRAQQAWSITTGSPNIRVAVLDMGVDLNHPDLIPNLLPGYDATGHFPSGHTDAGSPIGNHHDVITHGTAVAGIVAARGNNSIGIAGVAYNSRILPVRISRRTGWTIAAESEYIRRSIEWARANNADVINMSFGCFETDLLNAAIRNAAILGRNNKGIVMVAASGNSSFHPVAYPASSQYVISVGAINWNGIRAGSSFGPNLDVVAPGGDRIFTTWDIRGPVSGNIINDGEDGVYYTRFGSTSGAAPHVAGVAALMLSVNPYLTWHQVKNTIKHTAQRVRQDFYNYEYVDCRPYGGTWNNEMGYGLVDAYAAVKKALESLTIFEITGPDYITPTGTYSINTDLPIIWSVSDEFIIAEMSPCNTEVTVKPRFFDGSSGTLTAVVDGATITKNIQHVYIKGVDDVSTFRIFTLNTAQTARWNVTPGFRIIPEDCGTWVTVVAVDGSIYGTLTAELADGTILKKSINTYGTGIQMQLILHFDRELIRPDIVAFFRGMYTSPGERYPQMFSNRFNDFELYQSFLEIESDTYFTEHHIVLYGDYPLVRYNAIIEILCHYNDELVHVQHKTGYTFVNFAGDGVIDLFEDGWREPFYANSRYTIRVTLHIGVIEEPSPFALEMKNENLKVFIFPNPASGVLNVKIDTEKSDLIYDVRLYDNQGNLLRRSATTDGQVQFNVVNLPNGSYFLHVYDNESNTPIKRQVMIER